MKTYTVLFLYNRQYLSPQFINYIIWVTYQVPYKKLKLLSLREHMCSLRFFFWWGTCIGHHFFFCVVVKKCLLLLPCWTSSCVFCAQWYKCPWIVKSGLPFGFL
jgi:hypothetical protein